MQDLYSELHPVQTIKPAAQTASITGSGVDLKGYQTALVVVAIGAITDSKHVCALYECDTAAGSYTDVAAADIIGTEPTVSGNAQSVYAFGYKGSKRYIKLNTTCTGATTGAVFGAIVVRGLKRHETGGTASIQT